MTYYIGLKDSLKKKEEIMSTQFEFKKSQWCRHINNAIDYYHQGKDRFTTAYKMLLENKIAESAMWDKDGCSSFRQSNNYLNQSTSKELSDRKVLEQLRYMNNVKMSSPLVDCKNGHMNTIPRQALYKDFPTYYQKCSEKNCNEIIKFTISLEGIEAKELPQENVKQEAQKQQTDNPF